MWANVMICEKCWDEANPGRKAVRIPNAEEKACHNCGIPTNSGIYRREEVADAAPPMPRMVALGGSQASDLVKRILGGAESVESMSEDIIKGMADEVQPIARAIIKSGEATAAFADSMRAVGVLVPKPGMTKVMLADILGASIDSLVERLISIKASITTHEEEPPTLAD